MKSLQQPQETAIIVDGLCCATEEQLIRKKLRSLDGVLDLKFNIVSHTLVVRHACSDDKLLTALKDIGLPGTIQRESGKRVPRQTPPRQLYSTIFSGGFLIAGGLGTLLGFDPLFSRTCFLLSIVSGGWLIAMKGYKAAKNLSLDIHTLMTVAAVGAVAIGEYAEGAAVIFLFALSLLLESLSIDRSRRAIQSLMKLSPTRASVKRNGREVEAAVDDVRVGEIILVRPGERIPLDGEVAAGQSYVDQSTITGESLPVFKLTGDGVYAGTFNQRGALEVRVTKQASDSTLAHIIRLVEEAQQRRAPTQTFIEQFARYYTPAVFLLAIIVAVIPPLLLQEEFREWFYRALVLLVIACPCALVISTPVTILSAMTHAARRGILLKGGRYFEDLARIRAIALDKTGTLTEGKPVVTDIESFNGMPIEGILRIVSVAEVQSEHRLAEAFMKKAKEAGIDPLAMRVDSFEAIPGKGVRASIEGSSFIVGNHQLIEELGVCSPEVERRIQALETQGKTVVLLASQHTVLGALAVADRVREEGRSLVASLKGAGVEHVVMLTGDSAATARTISEQIHIAEHRAELLPDDKVHVVRALKNRYGNVAMVGDGVNDAPALAEATVGIAMGGIGSDTSLESADVVLMSDELAKVPYAIKLGKQTIRIVKQNVAIALATKAVFLVLALFGMTSLWLAVLADDGATLVVILNGLRLLRTNGEA